MDAAADARFWGFREAQLAANTVRAHRRAVIHFQEFLRSRKLVLQGLSSQDLADFVHWLQFEKIRPCLGGEQASPFTVNILIAGLRAWLRFHYDEGRLLEPLHNRLINCKTGLPLTRRRLNLEEVEAWLELPDLKCPLGMRDRAFFELAFGSGLRRAELLGLELSCVDLSAPTVRVEKTKTRRSRVVPMTRRAMAFVSLYLAKARPQLMVAPHEELWLDTGGIRLAKWVLNDRITRLYAPRLQHGDRMRLHALRHAFATQLLRGGADLRHVGELLGHQSLQSTVLYTEVVIDDLRQALRRHPRCQSGDSSE